MGDQLKQNIINAILGAPERSDIRNDIVEALNETGGGGGGGGGTVDLRNYYTKGQVDTKLATKADLAELADYAKKTDTTAALNAKADRTELANYQTTAAATAALALKADKTELEAFYTKEQADTLLNAKAAVSALANYYTKAETYSKQELTDLLDGIKNGLTVQIVDTLPVDGISTTTIYLVKVGDTTAYEQHMYIGGQWASLGSTQIDLTDYYTKADVDGKLALKVDTATFNAAIDECAKKTDLTQYAKTTEVAACAKTADLATVATTGAYGDLTGTPALKPVATSGSYNDLTDKPAVPTLPTLATVATSGSYTDLTNTPTIDAALSTTSENAVQNKAVTTEINKFKIITLHGGYDLNDFTMPDYVGIARGTALQNEVINAPEGVGGAFVIEYRPYDTGAEYGVQRLTQVQAGTHGYATYTRSRDAKTWSPWKRITTTDDFTAHDAVQAYVDSVPYNLLPFPYASKPFTANGITWTLLDDGAIVANGTTTQNNFADFQINPIASGWLLPTGTYTFSGGVDGGSDEKYLIDFRKYKNGANIGSIVRLHDSKPVTLDVINDGSYDSIYVFCRMRAGTATNLTFRPMIVEGTEAKPWSHGFKSAKELSSYVGANAYRDSVPYNLIPYPYPKSSETKNGLTITARSDGSVLVNGTATSNVFFGVGGFTGTNIYPSGLYRLSGCPAGGSRSTYRMDYAYRIVGSSTWLYEKNDVGHGVVIDTSGFEDGMQCVINISILNGTVCNNLVFKPMLVQGVEPKPFNTSFKTAKELTNSIPTIEYATDLFTPTTKPTLVWWDGNTLNTPYKAGLVGNSIGVALCDGSPSTFFTCKTWLRGNPREYSYCTASGNVINGGWTISGGGDAYATSELRTGRWIDGKPVYSKTLTSATKVTSIATGITNLNEMISIRGCCKVGTAGNTSWQAMPLVSPTGGVLSQHYYNIADNALHIIWGNFTSTITSIRFILEYTKTTD